MIPRLNRTLCLTLALVFFCAGVPLSPAPSALSQSAEPHSAATQSDLPRIVRSHRLPSAKDAQVIRAADIPDAVWKPGHRGVDLQASPGQVIVASRGGIVAFAGVVAGTPVVSISHSDGIRTTYEPVLARVRAGQKIRRGEAIGVLADAAALPDYARKSPGLSWGARLEGRKRAYIDPMTLLGSVRVRLWDAPG
ncbi:M23 family metallopeptidase [Corynebacterium sp. LK28]|uniref:M23 family metallopeptidase n=1 Tax=Corynebacterium sp. LK28 TaxID=2044579 RepID=UPI0005531A02|nr:M23 family metallopeptidase [Corynebacterium sp. LK28]MBC6795618.1 M23 family peptidase [Corynebacterium sp. LK28]